MSKIPSGTKRARPFLPMKDFDVSKRFHSWTKADNAGFWRELLL